MNEDNRQEIEIRQVRRMILEDLISNTPYFRDKREYNLYIQELRKLINDKDFDADKQEIIQYLETLQANNSPYQDPIYDKVMPSPVWKWMKTLLIVVALIFLVLAGAILAILYGEAQDIISPTVKTWLLAQGAQVIVAALILIPLTLLLINWLVDNLKNKLSK
jgi:hypothetical protein